MHHCFSAEFYADQQDGTFDWIYVDAKHDKENVLQDLQGAERLLKPGGLIIGDDYTAAHHKGHRGVREGVEAFLETSDRKFELLKYQQYVLHPA